jgi:pimeloyl-ACP methyl ester carboxylesterase
MRSAVVAVAGVLSACVTYVHEPDLLGAKRLAFVDETQRRNVEVSRPDGAILRGWFLAPAHPTRSVLYFYGGDGTVLASATELFWLASRLQANVLALDYRGFGFSDGVPKLTTFEADAVAAYDYLVNDLGQGQLPVIVSGYSLGTAMAIHVAAARPVSGVLLRAPITTPTDLVATIARHNVPWYAKLFVRIRPDPDLANLHPTPWEEMPNVKAPLAVIQGDKDEVADPDLSRKLFDRSTVSSDERLFCVVHGATHGDLDIVFGKQTGACLVQALPLFGGDRAAK